jgi:hypothetical protein
MAFSKAITIGERYSLKLNCNLNNAFNHPNYFAVGTKTPFGAVTTNNSAATAAGVINPAATTNASFGNLGNAGATVMARVIRIGAQFDF